jgi:hypothetical protein
MLSRQKLKKPRWVGVNVSVEIAATQKEPAGLAHQFAARFAHA